MRGRSCGVGNSSSCVVGWLSVGGVLVGWVCLCDTGVRRMLKRILLKVGWVSGGCVLVGKLVACVRTMALRGVGRGRARWRSVFIKSAGGGNGCNSVERFGGV